MQDKYSWEKKNRFFRSGCVGAGRGSEKILGQTRDTYGIYLVGKAGNVQVRPESWFEAQEKGKG